MRGLSEFLLDFTNALMGSGTQTSRVLRNVERLAENFDCRADVIILPKTIIMTLSAAAGGGNPVTSVRKISPAVPDFTVLSNLRILSWEAYRQRMGLAECREKFREATGVKRPSWITTALIVSAGNAAFCQLFGGLYAVPLVFLSTLAGFWVRGLLLKSRINIFMVFALAAFVSAFIAGLGARLIPAEADVALSTSVLYLIPGVPLLNSMIDLMDGHALAGFSRLTHAAQLILAMAFGLFFSTLVLGGSAL